MERLIINHFTLTKMKELFEKAERAKSLSELNVIIASDDNISNFVGEFENKYPRFDLQIESEEVRQLIETLFLNDDHTINLEREAGFTPFEKLLLAVLWKNGQIFRVRPIVKGILGHENSGSDFGIIFHQFGKSLANPNEPIIDQHVLRAFSEYGDLSKISGRKKVPRKSVFKETDRDLINAYCNWFKGILEHIPEEERNEFKYRLDKLLFAIGKKLE